jgi:hypothetical protein
MSFNQRLSPYRNLDLAYQLNTILLFFNIIIWITNLWRNPDTYLLDVCFWLFNSLGQIYIDPVDIEVTFHGFLGGRLGAASPHNCDRILSC